MHGWLFLRLFWDWRATQVKDRSHSDWKAEETFYQPWNSRYISQWQWSTLYFKWILPFAVTYEFEHVTSSSEYPQSNGKVENAVKTAKHLMKKSASTSSDFHLALLDWRNTPTEGMKSSPAQRMFGRRTRTLLPTSKKLLKAQLVTDVRERKLQRRHVIRHVITIKMSKNLPASLKVMLYAWTRTPPMESRDGPRHKLNNKYMSDPTLLEQKMAGCSEETGGIFDSQRNRSCLKMRMLKFQVQFWTVHQPQPAQKPYQEERTAQDALQHCPESDQSQDHQLPVQPHWLSAKRAIQSHAADALFAPLAT